MIGRRVTAAACALTLGVVLVLVGAPDAHPASAAAPHRAAVVVDLGNGQVKVGCASFTEDHISGLEALDRASMAPVAQTFSGQGGAVCAICGKGCAAGSSCLTCRAPNYWAYYHDGVYSSVGATATAVRDGDTEAWKWGKGEAPARVAFSQVCSAKGPPPTPAPTTSTAPDPFPAPSSGGTGGLGGSLTGPNVRSPGPSPTVSGSAVPPTTAPRSGSAIGSPTTGSSSTTSPATSSSRPRRAGTTPASRAARGPTGRESAASAPRHLVIQRAGTERRSPSGQAGDSSSLLSIGGFVIAVVVVAGLVVVVRRRRLAAGR